MLVFNNEQQIHQNNWSYVYYGHTLHGKAVRAMISQGAELTENNNIKDLYYVSVVDEDFQLIGEQFVFDELSAALTDINQRFSSWTFTNQMAQKEKEGGCSSCAAH